MDTKLIIDARAKIESEKMLGVIRHKIAIAQLNKVINNFRFVLNVKDN